MAQYLKRLFSGLCWQERLCYGTLALLVTAILSWWKLAIIALILFTVSTLLNTLRHTPSCGKNAFAFVAMIVYWLLLVFSALYSTNHAEGWSTVSTQFPMLLLPLFFLFGNTRHLTRPRIESLFRLMAVVLLLRFVACIGVDFVRHFQGTPWAELRDWQFDPLGLHHNYLALYINTALAYLFCAFIQKPEKRGNRIVAAIAAALLIAYLLISGSRSGLVTLLVLVFACLFHRVFFRHQWKLALAAAVLIPMLIVGTYLACPQLYKRYTSIYTEYAAGRRGDDRPMLVRCGLSAAKEKPLLGHGTGDYMEVLIASYESHDFAKGVSHHYDCHNQYVETLVANGLVGLILLLVLLLAPVVIALRTKCQRLLVVLVVTAIMLQLLFESMLDRQMGVQFVPLVYCLLIRAISDCRNERRSLHDVASLTIDEQTRHDVAASR